MKKLFFSLLCFLFLSSTVGESQLMVTHSVTMLPTHIVVQPTLMYQNIQIYGFTQEIPIEFNDMLELYTQAATSPEVRSQILAEIDGKINKDLVVTPENDLLNLKKAVYLFENKEYRACEEILMNLVDRSAKALIKEEAHFYLGLIAAARSKFNDSEYFFSEVLVYNKSRFYAVINLGLAQLLNNKLNVALKTFEQAKAMNADVALANYYIGIIKHVDGRQKDAVTQLHDAAIYKPKDPIIQSTIDQLMSENEQIKLLLELVSKINDDPNLYARLGFNYSQYGSLEKSNSYFLKALELKPGHYGALTGLSENYLLLRNFEKAEQYADQVLLYFPTHELTVLLGKGRIRYFANDFKGAETFFLKAINIASPKDEFRPRAMLGQMYAEQGRIAEAKEQLSRCMNQKDDRTVQELMMKIRQYEN